MARRSHLHVLAGTLTSAPLSDALSLFSTVRRGVRIHAVDPLVAGAKSHTPHVRPTFLASVVTGARRPSASGTIQLIGTLVVSGHPLVSSAALKPRYGVAIFVLSTLYTAIFLTPPHIVNRAEPLRTGRVFSTETGSIIRATFVTFGYNIGARTTIQAILTPPDQCLPSSRSPLITGPTGSKCEIVRVALSC